jgi:hypothetical protein
MPKYLNSKGAVEFSREFVSIVTRLRSSFFGRLTMPSNDTGRDAEKLSTINYE